MSNIDIRFKTGLMAWAMAVTVARAARYPNDFAEAHWLLDYRFGLIRRGLAGSIFTLLTSARILTPSAGTVAGVAFVVFAAFCVTLLA
ncbi:MAG: hypothetical protein NTY02_20235, partial [Acidobacteria bacterium]|nr:hypothetical protein [Acidobacteriota bacterium]